MKVMVIATHADDEILGCGGTLARHTAHGEEVHVLVVTRGAKEIFSDKQMARVRSELKQALSVVGAKGCYFLDFPAPKLDTVPNHKIADGIKKVLASVKPSIVYLPHRGDIHVDHKAVYNATLVAARPTQGDWIKRLLSYETLSETDWASPSAEDAFVPTVFIDISSHIETKLKAMGCYQSKLKPTPHPRSLDALKALARLRGSTVGFEWAEAFMLVREKIG